MARRLLLWLTAGVVAGVSIAACVGDDPSSGTTPDGDGGPGGGEASTADSPSGADGAVPADGGVDGPIDTGIDAAVPYEITSLKGLRMWLESTKKLAIVGGGDNSFASWTDSSPKDGGTVHVALPQNVNPPTIVANGFGGRPTLSFVNGNGYLKVSNEGAVTNEPDFAFGLGDFMIVVVAKVTSFGALWVLRPQATGGSEEQFLATGLCVSYGMGVLNGCTAPNIPLSTAAHVYVARRKSDIFTVRVDSTISASLDRTASPVDININMFTQPSAFIGNASDMQLSELAIVIGPTPDADLATLENHLKAKYLIP
jgi:hypothetical protein